MARVLYIIPFIAIPVIRGPFSIVFVYVLGRIVILANDFAHPLYASSYSMPTMGAYDMVGVDF